MLEVVSTEGFIVDKDLTAVTVKGPPQRTILHTNEMNSERVHLVLPRGLHSTYLPAQQNALIDVSAFLNLTQQRQ